MICHPSRGAETDQHDAAVSETVPAKASDFLPPQHDFLLFEIAAVLLINEHEVEPVAAGEAIIDVFVAGCQVCGGQVKSHRNQFALYWRAIHDLKLAERLVFGDCVLVCADCLLANDGNLHHLDLDSH